MRSAVLRRSAPQVQVRVRAGTLDDLAALVALEQRVFAHDAMSRACLRRFLRVATADVLIAECGGALAGCAIVLFRATSNLARLYSLAVARECEGCGVAPALLDACEQAAAARRCVEVRLEVHEDNSRAIACYRKAGYEPFGRHVGYYKDLGDALRFRKRLAGP